MKFDLKSFLFGVVVEMILGIFIPIKVHAEDIQQGAPYLKSVPAEQCPVYTTFAKAIMEMRNSGKSEVEAVPEVMKMISGCTANKMCPLKEGLQTQRILGFVSYVYGLNVPDDKQINIDASAANIERDCEQRAAAAKQQEEHPPMTPDPSVPITGKQIES